MVKDLNIVVVDAARGFGNGRVLPAGPLREPVRTGLRRADMVLSIGGPPDQAGLARLWASDIAPLPLIEAKLAVLQTGLNWHGLRLLAFAGIAHPERFFSTLRDLGAEVVRGEALEDHQPLTSVMLQRLEAEARSQGAQLVTTEKDAVRLPDHFRSKVLTLPVRLEVSDWTLFDAILRRVVG